MIVIVGDRHAGRWGHSGPEKHFFQGAVWTVGYCAGKTTALLLMEERG